MGANEYFASIETIRLDLLDVLGRGYVIEHCIASFLKRRKTEIFEDYVATCAKNINEILAKRYGGSYMQTSLHDLRKTTTRKQDKRTAEEVALDVIKKAGLRPGG